MRYEYVSPYREKQSHRQSESCPGFTAVAPVLPGQTGPYTGAVYLITLVRPDRNNFAPRIGFAWKPFEKTVVRGGYGINYNTGAYQTIVQQLAFQPPFSTTQTNIQVAPGRLDAAEWISGLAANAITNNYAINPNYRLGYVQIRNLDIQQQIRADADAEHRLHRHQRHRPRHSGSTQSDSRWPSHSRRPAFTFENSVGDSEANAGSVRLRKRLSNGFSIGGLTRTPSQSTMRPPSAQEHFGSGERRTGTVRDRPWWRRIPFDLAASAGFPVSIRPQIHRRLFVGAALRARQTLAHGPDCARVFGDWQWSGDWTIASGLPFTPRLLGHARVIAGHNGTLRPTCPGQSFGCRIRDRGMVQHGSILLRRRAVWRRAPQQHHRPGKSLFDMAFTKVIPLKESRMLEFRAPGHSTFSTIPNILIDRYVGQVADLRASHGGGRHAANTMTARFRFKGEHVSTSDKAAYHKLLARCCIALLLSFSARAAAAGYTFRVQANWCW